MRRIEPAAGQKLAPLRAGILPFLIFFMTGLCDGLYPLVESAALAQLRVTLGFSSKAVTVCCTKRRPCTPHFLLFLWLSWRSPGAVFDGLGAVRAIENPFVTSGTWPRQVIIMMQLSFIVMFLMTRRCWSRRAALCPARRNARSRLRIN